MSDADPGLMTIFTEALERTDPVDRAAYLDGACAGDAALRRRVEALLAAQPEIAVPTIALQGDADGVHPPDASAKHAAYFSGPYQRRVLPRIGHNPPQEAPQVFADAILELIK